MGENYTTSDVAARLGVSTQTVRRYAQRFGIYLSSSAAPESGRARRYLPRDIWILEYVCAQAGAGHTYDEIDLLLDTVDVPDVVALETDPPNETQLPAQAQGLAALRDMGETLEGVRLILAQMQHNQALEERIRELEQGQDTRLPWLVAGAVALAAVGVVAFVIIEAGLVASFCL